VDAVPGDIRLLITLRNNSGKAVPLELEAKVRWADLGDRIEIPRIKFLKSGLGHFCY